MAEALIERQEQSGIARLMLNRPRKRNALTRELLRELRGHLADLEHNANLRLLVLGARGPAFCAGMDLAQMQETSTRPDAMAAWQADTDLFRDVVTTLWNWPTPTLVVAPGPALAGGLGLLLACDLVIAAESATFSLPEPQRGITAAVVTPLLVARLGRGIASFLLLSGQAIDARRAFQVGLCHAVAPADGLDATAHDFEKSILSGAPGALRLTKQNLLGCEVTDIANQLVGAARVSAAARETPEAREGLQAFLEQRAPAWKPRG
jgi:methylglutaconyl-CoA hydratase